MSLTKNLGMLLLSVWLLLTGLIPLLFGTPYRYGHPRDRCRSLDPGGTVDPQTTITRPNRALERTRGSVVDVRLTPRSFSVCWRDAQRER